MWLHPLGEEVRTGGVAVCFREAIRAQQLYRDSSPLIEVMYFRVTQADRSALQLCAIYRPPRQGPDSVLYLTKALENLMLAHSCSHVLIVGDLKYHLERDAYENLLEV